MVFRHCPQESFLGLMSQSDFHGSNSFICRVAWSAMRGSRLLVGPPGVVRFEGKQLQEIWWWFSLFCLSLSLSLSLKHILIFKEKREVLQHPLPQTALKTKKDETFWGIDFRYCLNGNCYTTTPPPNLYRCGLLKCCQVCCTNFATRIYINEPAKVGGGL